MNNKNSEKAKLLSIISILLLLLLASINALAQIKQVDIPAPSDEEFQAADGVINKASNFPGRKAYEFSELDIIHIYNADKTIWYEFSFGENSPVNFWKNKKPEFQPFVPFELYGLFFRVKAESKNWYEIVVNEETQATKYTWKGDRLLGYRSLEYYIKFSYSVAFDTEKNPFRETPDGKVINIKYEFESNRYTVLQIEGDWLLVHPFYTPTTKGWIRWRKDRKILVGYYLNNRIVPEQ